MVRSGGDLAVTVCSFYTKAGLSPYDILHKIVSSLSQVANGEEAGAERRNREKNALLRLLKGGRCASIRSAVGVSPSGKAADFESAIPRFESWHPSLHAGAFV